MRKTLIVLGSAVMAGAGLGAAPAAADPGATVSAQVNTARFAAAWGEVNKITVTEIQDAGVGHDLYVFDDVVPITPGENCFRPYADDATVVSCRIEHVGDIPSVSLELFDGNDEATVRTSGIGSVHAGDGDDTVTGNNTFHETFGEAGNDTLTHSHLQIGGPGNDTIRPSVNGWAYGDDGHDTILGADGTERIYGGPGDDVIYGQEGDDLLRGDAGRDEISGGTGNDEIRGGTDADTIFGNSGDDVLYGGGGVDELSGGAGANRLYQDWEPVGGY